MIRWLLPFEGDPHLHTGDETEVRGRPGPWLPGPRTADRDQAPGRRVLEYGCGTGAAACFLAHRGYQVDAVDLAPDAVARRFAAELGLEIRFAVQNFCQWPDVDDRFDYAIDIFCLQSVVTDADRGNLLASAHHRLKRPDSAAPGTPRTAGT